MEIKQSRFLVTGGASGLGAATAEMVVSGGGSVVIADLNVAEGEALAARLGAQARFIRTDVADPAQGKAAVDLAQGAFGGLDGLVNCAGVAVAARVLGKDGPQDLAAFNRVVQINLIGTFNMIRLGAELMARNTPNAEGERGVIVNTASVAAFDGQIGQASYSASKAAVAGMTLPIAREFARIGIRVVTIAPGLFETPMLKGLPEEAQRSLGQQVPFPPRLGRPPEYALLVRQIIKNVMLNGETIRLDGAIRMAPK